MLGSNIASYGKGRGEMKSQLLFLLVFTVLAGQTPQAQAPDHQIQRGLADDLVGNDFVAKSKAAGKALTIPAQAREAMLWDAVYSEADRMNHEMARRDRALRNGETVKPDHALGDYEGTLLELLSQSTDPQAIPLLIESNGSPIAMAGLAKFGEAAVPDLIVAAGSSSSTHDQVAGVLGAFQMMLAAAESRPISPETRETIISIARSKLSRTEDPVVVCAAIRLAIETRQPDLRALVADWARDPLAMNKELPPIWVHVIQDQAKKALLRK